MQNAVKSIISANVCEIVKLCAILTLLYKFKKRCRMSFMAARF